jgi:hypothetical protein
VSCNSISPQKKSPNLAHQLEKLLKVKLDQEDLQILAATNAVINSYQNFSLDKYENSMAISKEILYTPHLTPELYKFALSFYTLSLTFSIDEKPLFEKRPLLKKMNFDTFQYEECNELCDSIGWKILAQENTAIFTPEGYRYFLVRQDILDIAHKKLPSWFIQSILPQEKNSKNVAADIGTPPLTISTAEQYSPMTKSLKLFLNGEFHNSIKELVLLSKNFEDRESLAAVSYWIGRNYFALHDTTEANKYFLLSGTTNPLGLYDSLSGQMLKNKSGKASTTSLSPFNRAWQKEIDTWISYPKSNINLKSAILLSSEIRIERNFQHFIDYQNDFDSNHETIEKIILKDEIKWLKDNWLDPSPSITWGKSPQNTDAALSIAWLLYSTGDFLNSAIFISQVKDTFDLASEKNNFLYFIFYPRPYKDLMQKATTVCSVDPDLIYAILRQESFFVIKQNENSLHETACALHTLLKKYDNNIVSAITSYKANTSYVDELRQKLSQTQDDVIFIEMIPDEKLRSFVQDTLRNYYNIKWIYSQKRQKRFIYEPFLTHK